VKHRGLSLEETFLSRFEAIAENRKFYCAHGSYVIRNSRDFILSVKYGGIKAGGFEIEIGQITLNEDLKLEF